MVVHGRRRGEQESWQPYGHLSSGNEVCTLSYSQIVIEMKQTGSGAINGATRELTRRNFRARQIRGLLIEEEQIENANGA